MAVVSVRFNDKEIKILKILKKYYNCDYSSLLKLSLWDLYEEIKDKEIIEEFEEKEKSSKTGFVKIEDLISEDYK
jgi:hypothetical protein